MLVKPYLSVVIPAYNEEERIKPTLDAVYSYLSQQSYSWEILIVLDGCTDNTLQVVDTFSKGKAGICFIDRKENRGKGYTLKQGMLAAQGDVRLFTDADNSTDITHFEQMTPYFANGSQVVICSRDSKDHPMAKQALPQPLIKRLFGNLGNLVIQVLAVPGIWDTQCGFKAFTAEAAETIFSLTKINRYAIDIEALALARNYQYQIAIVGAHWVDQEGTHVKAVDYLHTFWEAAKVRWYLLSGQYTQPQAMTADRKNFGDIAP